MLQFFHIAAACSIIVLLYATGLLAQSRGVPLRGDTPGFREFLEERNGMQPGATATHPAVFWSILTAVFLLNVGGIVWSMHRRRVARRSKQPKRVDFKSYR